MSGKLTSVLIAIGFLIPVAIALPVPPSDFGTSVIRWTYPTKPDFDWVFAEVETVSTLNPERTAADRGMIRLEVLKQMNLGQFSE